MSKQIQKISMVVIGDTGVGKSCLLLQFVDRRFSSVSFTGNVVLISILNILRLLCNFCCTHIVEDNVWLACMLSLL